jgi:hypothetical protein
MKFSGALLGRRNCGDKGIVGPGATLFGALRDLVICKPDAQRRPLKAQSRTAGRSFGRNKNPSFAYHREHLRFSNNT